MKIPKNIKAVIFDMDGLLIDSEIIWDKADNVLLKKRGFIPTPELFLKRLGIGNIGTLEIYKKEFGIKEDTKALATERWEIFYDMLWKELRFMEGAEKLIKNLKNHNFKLAIATGGHTPEILLKIVKKLNISSYFDVLTSGYEVKRHKPYPDIFLYASKKLGIDSSECLVLEDAPNGVLAGKAAGMKVWGVNKSASVHKELKEAAADKVFSSLIEIEV